MASGYEGTGRCQGINGELNHQKRQKHHLRDQYEVLHSLGEGTYGKVHLAKDKATEELVAIKTILKSKVPTDIELHQIHREIEMISALTHPHIIHAKAVFENSHRIVIVMEYASQGELYDYISKHRLTERQARHFFRQIVSAVYYMHQNNVVHRDLKLENILIDANGDVKIADFGLSNVYSKYDKLCTFCGSPLYASPEMVNSRPYFGPEVDVWSLGVLLYCMVYGSMPFDGSNFKKLSTLISNAQYKEPHPPAGSTLVRVTTRMTRRRVMRMKADPPLTRTLTLRRRLQVVVRRRRGG